MDEDDPIILDENPCKNNLQIKTARILYINFLFFSIFRGNIFLNVKSCFPMYSVFITLFSAHATI